MMGREQGSSQSQGTVVRAFGNLLQVAFEGNVRQGAVGYVQLGDVELKAEVIEIAGTVAKLQVYEQTYDIRFGTPIRFTEHLLEAELGPGLLAGIFDGLQSPLEEVAHISGVFLQRGVYVPSLSRSERWEFHGVAHVGDQLRRGDTLGTTQEGRFTHRIMVPFNCFGSYKLTWIAPTGGYLLDDPIAKAVDSEGRELTWTMVQRWPVKMALQEGERLKVHGTMSTGLRIIDTQFPIARGGSFCTPGPFGAGKTVLQHHLAKYSDVDIVVVVACGERAGEVVEMLREFPHLIDPHTGQALSSRTVMICNTSSMPVAAREASIYMGMTIAEYYRQMGYNVLALADSTSRWAQALREMSGRLEEIPGEEAFPAYLASRISAFYERCGLIELRDKRQGSITLCGAVSPAGGNFEEPVTQATLAVVGAFLGLSRARSDSRRYPAVDPLISWSKYVDLAARQLEDKVPGWGQLVHRAQRLLIDADEIRRRMEVVGEEGTPIEDLVLFLKGELFDFVYLQQNAFDSQDAYCPMERQLELFSFLQRIFVAQFDFPDRDSARTYFLHLQGQLKNMNYVEYRSAEYQQALKDMEELLSQGIEAGVGV
jgi:V/A-type H+/Na+-transporting ATPase subunit A